MCLVVPCSSLFSLMVHRFGVWVDHRYGDSYEGGYLRSILKLLYWSGRYISVIFRKIEIEEAAELDSDIWLSNKGNILLGPKQIGKNCIINQNVTIGFGFGVGQEMDRPQLGDWVWVGANSVIHGGIRIGSGVLILPDSVVGKNIPPGCIVGGNPAKIIKRDVTITDSKIFNVYAGPKGPPFPAVS